MTDYKKLCEDLRFHAEYSEDGDYIDLFPYVEGFEELIAENDRLKMTQSIELDGEAANSFTLALELSEARAEIDRLKKQLDEKELKLLDVRDDYAVALAENATMKKQLEQLAVAWNGG